MEPLVKLGLLSPRVTSSIRLRIRKWIEQHAVDDRKEGGVDADAQSERKNRNDCVKPGFLRNMRIA